MISHVTVKRYVRFLFYVFPSVMFFICFPYFSTFHITGTLYASYTAYHYFVQEVFMYHLIIFIYAKRDPIRTCRTFVVIVSDIIRPPITKKLL